MEIERFGIGILPFYGIWDCLFTLAMIDDRIRDVPFHLAICDCRGPVASR